MFLCYKMKLEEIVSKEKVEERFRDHLLLESNKNCETMKQIYQERAESYNTNE